MKPVITSMRFSSVPERKKPRMGDRRTTKKHGEQIRLPVVHDGMLVMSSGRQLYEWASLAEAVKRGYRHLVERTAT